MELIESNRNKLGCTCRKADRIRKMELYLLDRDRIRSNYIRLDSFAFDQSFRLYSFYSTGATLKFRMGVNTMNTIELLLNAVLVETPHGS